MRTIAILGALLIAVAIGVGKAHPESRDQGPRDDQRQSDGPSTILVETGSVEYRLQILEKQVLELRKQALQKAPEHP